MNKNYITPACVALELTNREPILTTSSDITIITQLEIASQIEDLEEITFIF